MDDKLAVTVRIGADGNVKVELDGKAAAEPEDLIETQESEPVAAFRDDAFREGRPPVYAAGY